MSAVVTTLIIILLVIVAMGIVWVVVKSLFLNQAKEIEFQRKFFDEGMTISQIKFEQPIVTISLRKVGGESTTKKAPEIPDKPDADVFSVVDLSGSMRACYNVNSTCGGGTQYGVGVAYEDTCINYCGGTWEDRLTPTQQANTLLIDTLLESDGNRVGLIAYSSSIKISDSLDLGTDKITLNLIIDAWEAGGGTCICCGINEAVNRLNVQSTDEQLKTIIVMSDGDATTTCSQQGTGNAGSDAIQAACDANQSIEDLTIYSVGAGENVNVGTLTAIAECGNGEYFSGADINNLTEIYKSIGEKINVQHIFTHSFNNVLFVFYNSTDSYKEYSSEIPEVLRTNSYEINLSGKLGGELIKIEIYPLVISSSGKETIGPLFDTWKKY